MFLNAPFLVLNARRTRRIVLLPAVVCAAGCVTALQPGGSAPDARIRPAGLRCEYRQDPLGIDVRSPRLSWQCEAAQPGVRSERQTAYRILVASTAEGLANGSGDLWDTGKVKSHASLHVTYEGAPLVSGQRVFWKVRVWDSAGHPSEYSQPAAWEMALLDPDDWQGRWISDDTPQPATEAEMFDERPAPLLRKEFALAKPVRSARAYVTGLGYYELRLNGAKVRGQVLDPGWTAYGKRVLYSAYDVTAHLHQGANAVGIMLGNGWYNPLPLRMWNQYNLREHLATGAPRAILQLNIEYQDGTRDTVATDTAWRTSAGPILRNSVYLGEEYDARREQPGWDQAGFDDSGWRPAIAASEPVGPLQAQWAPPIRENRTVTPVAITEPTPNVFIVDMGENFAGWVTLRVQGEAGTRVDLRYGELLYPDGTLNGMTSVCGQIKGGGVTEPPGTPETAFQRDSYVLKGAGGIETYTPRFSFHGFRYVELTGFPGIPTLDAVEGHALSSDVTPAGTFSCSNALFNDVQAMTRRTLLSNLFSVQSDCPHREKFGYGGDIVASSEMAMLNFDMAAFYTKAVRDLADSVRPNGGFTETAPFVGISYGDLGDLAGPVGWGTAHPLLLWQLHQYYGETALLAEQYHHVQRWLALLDAHAQDGILDNGIGDHESLVPKSTAVSGTAFYYYNTRLASEIARTLGRKRDARRYAAKAEAIRKAFNVRFLKDGRYDIGTQACQAFALYMGLAPEAERDAVVQALVDDIAAHDNHLTTGIFGTKYLLDTLSANGRADLAYAIADQRTFPGWGHMLANGATTLWEHWEFSDNTFSHNHPMFGSVSEWFCKNLAGISPAQDASGFDRFVIRPRVVGGLTWAKGRYDSIRGPITSEWRVEDGVFHLDVEIPVNTEAMVHVPAEDMDAVREGDLAADEAEGLAFAGIVDGAAVFRAGSGSYHFSVPPAGG